MPKSESFTLLERFLEVAELAQDRNRAKGFLAANVGIVGGILEQRRFEHRALAFATHQQLRTRPRLRFPPSLPGASLPSQEIIGPMKTDSSRGSPIFKTLVASTNFDENSA